MSTTNRYCRSVIDLDDAKRAIDHAAQGGVKSVSFTGGEPFLVMNELLELIRHAQGAGIPCIRTGTNGYFFCHNNESRLLDRVKRIAEVLAGTSLYTLWVSIDSSSPRTHESMRGLSGMISGIEKALPLFHEYGLYPAANLGINRNMGGEGEGVGSGLTLKDAITDACFYERCRSSLESYYRFIIDLGFTITNTCYPMSIAASGNTKLDPVYGAVSDDAIVNFTSAEKGQLYRALFEVIPCFRSSIRIFTPRASLCTLMAEQGDERSRSFGCRGGIDYYYIDCHTGNAYPCGYRGTESVGKFWNVDLKKNRARPYCRLCDWECFRDPSSLLGPILEPGMLVDFVLHDRAFLRIWSEDLNYYRACDFFNGRKPASAAKLARFQQ
jgi:MoaA/NifB/PqqE/SkfB family radical SAM enzyme